MAPFGRGGSLVVLWYPMSLPWVSLMQSEQELIGRKDTNNSPHSRQKAAYQVAYQCL